MPTAIPRACLHGGCCIAAFDGAYCDAHRKAKDKALEASRPRGHNAHYKTARWQRLRVMVLRRDPICQQCGRAVSTDVDHIIDLDLGGQDTMGNLQGLCHACHSRKTRSGP
jgi:5-methylcytosine-specific restriction protein A